MERDALAQPFVQQVAHQRGPWITAVREFRRPSSAYIHRCGVQRCSRARRLSAAASVVEPVTDILWCPHDVGQQPLQHDVGSRRSHLPPVAWADPGRCWAGQQHSVVDATAVVAPGAEQLPHVVG